MIKKFDRDEYKIKLSRRQRVKRGCEREKDSDSMLRGSATLSQQRAQIGFDRWTEEEEREGFVASHKDAGGTVSNFRPRE